MVVSPLPKVNEPPVTSVTIVAIAPGPVVFPAGNKAAPPRTSEAPSRETTATRVRIAASLLIASSFGQCLAPVFSFSGRGQVFLPLNGSGTALDRRSRTP